MTGIASRSFLALLFLSGALSAQPISVSGTVVAPDGEPLAGATVTLAAIEAGRPAPAARATTDREGRFQLEAPGSGLWRLVAGAGGHLPVELRLVPLVEETLLAPLELPRARLRPLTLRDAAGRALSGARWLAQPVAEVQPRPGSPWPRARGEARPAEISGTTGSDGSIELPCAEAVRWRLVVAADGLAPRAEDLPDGCDAASWTVTGGVERTVELVGPRGRPVEGVEARLEGVKVAGPSDRDGRLALRFDPARAAALSLQAPDGWRAEVGPSPAPPTPWRVTLEPVPEVTGRVMVAEPYEPLPGAVVWLEGAGILAGYVLSDRRGGFRLSAPVGSVQLRAAAPGFAPGVLPASPMTEGELILALRPAASLAGEVVDEKGAPVRGAIVTLGPEGRLTAHRAISTADGRFHIRGVPPGFWPLLSASAPGFVGKPLVVEGLESGEPVTGLRLVLTAQRAGFGLVVDPEGRPVAGAEVYVTARPSGAEERELRMGTEPGAPVVSAEEGRFRVEALPPAQRLEVIARAEGFAPAIEADREVDAGRGPLDLGTLRLGPEAVVSGRVVDRSGLPVAGARVGYRLSRGLPGLTQGTPRPIRALLPRFTDEEGRFRFGELPSGARISVWVEHDDYLSATTEDVEVPLPDSPLEVVLEPAARLLGRVVAAGGEPIAGAEVEVDPVSPLPPELRRSRPWRAARARTDEEGRFEVKKLAGGPYRVAASARSYLPASPRTIEVPAGSKVEGFDLVLSKGAVLEGQVLDEAGQPVLGAWVSQVRELSGELIRDGGTGVDGAGRYRLEGIAPGHQQLAAGAEGWLSVEKSVEVTETGGRLDFTLRRGATVRGRVIDAEGVPVPRANVVLEEQAGGPFLAMIQSGREGSFSIGGVPPGRYVIAAQREGYRAPAGPTSVEVGGQAVEDLELVLDRGGAIVGAVTGVEPAETVGLRVAAFDGKGPRASAAVDARGRFRLEGLAPGSYQVQAVPGAQNLSGSAAVELAEGALEASVTLPLAPGLSLSGQLLWGTAPVERMHLALEGEAGRASTMTDEKGRFALRGLKPGRYRMVLSTLGERMAAAYEQVLTLDADQTLELDLSQLPRAAP
ncbi:MAG TPA: carboxypeptidase regulatory-like domain-containing protein [Thermoanaerobaculia bacterium]|nr:carboxypeptidase regulatory-like domain-containing protein [Thermoanaerobaculia bacterium]